MTRPHIPENHTSLFNSPAVIPPRDPTTTMMTTKTKTTTRSSTKRQSRQSCESPIPTNRLVAQILPMKELQQQMSSGVGAVPCPHDIHCKVFRRMPFPVQHKGPNTLSRRTRCSLLIRIIKRISRRSRRRGAATRIPARVRWYIRSRTPSEARLKPLGPMQAQATGSTILGLMARSRARTSSSHIEAV